MVTALQIVPKTFTEHDVIVSQGIQAFDRGMESLLVILDGELWREKYNSESAYLRAVAKREGKHRTWLIRQISLFKGRASLEGTDYVDVLSESIWRELKKFDVDHHVLILQTVVTRYGKLTASRVRRVGEDFELQARGNDSQLHLADQDAAERQQEAILAKKGYRREHITFGKLREIPLRQLRQWYNDPTVHITLYRLVKDDG